MPSLSIATPSFVRRIVAAVPPIVLAAMLALGSCQALAQAPKDTLAQSFKRIGELTGEARFADALKLSEEAAARARVEHGEGHPEVARALAWQAYLLQAQSRLSEAEPVFKQSLAIYEQALPPGHADIATAINNLGFQYQLTDRLLDAETLYKRALAMREKALKPNDPAIADSLNNLAQVYKHQGRTIEALPLLQRSLEIRLKALPTGHPLLAQSLTNMGSALERLGKFAQGEPYLRQALKIRLAAQSADHPDVAGAMNKLAQNLSSQEKFEDADRLFEDALKARSKSQPADHIDVANNLHDRAQNYNAMKRYVDAEKLLVRAIDMRKRLYPANHPTIAHATADLASVVLSQGRSDDALTLIRSGVDMLLKRGKLDDMGRQRFNEFVQIAWRVRETSGDQPEIHKLLDEALMQGQRATATPTSAAVSRMAARFSDGDAELRRLLRQRDDAEALQARLERDLSDALAQPAKKRAVSVEAIQTELAGAQTKIADIDRTIKERFPRYFELVNPAPLNVETVRENLRTDEALLNFLVDRKNVYLWAVTSEAVEWRRIDVSPDALARDVATLRDTLDLQTLASAGAKAKLFDLGLSHKLYATLLGPVEKLFENKRNLIVVANGALTSLPLQLLVKTRPAVASPTLADLSVYQSADWLVRHHAISVLPSVTSLVAIRGVARKASPEEPMIGFANPALGRRQSASLDTVARLAKDRATNKGKPAAKARPAKPLNYTTFWRGPAADMDALRSGLEELPESETELRAVAKNLQARDQDLIVGGAATEAAVKSAKLDRYGIVYFATHGLIAGEVQGLGEPALVFSIPSAPSEVDDGLLTASEVTQLDLDADWVVLSACNTAAGDKPGAEALSGLARAFFHAGARAMLVSHWRVGSDAATQLTTATFDVLQKDPGAGRAEAMRRAMTALLDDNRDPWNAYPSFWAPFSVVGEGHG